MTPPLPPGSLEPPTPSVVRRPRASAFRRAQSWALWTHIAVWTGFLVIAITYVPVIWLAVMSFSGQPLSGIPNPLTLRWYLEMLADTRWAPPLWGSVGLGALVALCCMVVATALGRAVPRMRKRGGVLLLAFLPMFVPGLTMGAALFLFLRSYLELRLGLWSVFFGHLVWALPFALLLVLVLAARFDHRLLEAASDLGASAFQRFWHIEFPIMRPAVIGAGLFGFLLSFNELPRSLFLRGTSTTLPVFQWAQASSHQSMVPVTFALASIIFAVTIPLMGGFFWFLFAKLEKRG